MMGATDKAARDEAIKVAVVAGKPRLDVYCPLCVRKTSCGLIW